MSCIVRAEKKRDETFQVWRMSTCECACVRLCLCKRRDDFLFNMVQLITLWMLFFYEKNLQCYKYLHRLVYSLPQHSLNSSPTKESVTFTGENTGTASARNLSSLLGEIMILKLSFLEPLSMSKWLTLSRSEAASGWKRWLASGLWLRRTCYDKVTGFGLIKGSRARELLAEQSRNVMRSRKRVGAAGSPSKRISCNIILNIAGAVWNSGNKYESRIKTVIGVTWDNSTRGVGKLVGMDRKVIWEYGLKDSLIVLWFNITS